VREQAPRLVELFTERLHLRPVRAEDAGVAAAIGADERVMEWFGGAFSREKSDEWLVRVVAHWQGHGFGRFAVVAHGSVVGFVGLSRTDFDAGIVPGVEIAWRLAFDQWGKGYATEAARAVLRDGFERLGLDVIVACTAESNARSRRVMDRLGMVHSPAETFEHPLVPAGDPLRLHVVYRLSRP
jgi:RimJ/RimL family protein N-acetyltransferase